MGVPTFWSQSGDVAEDGPVVSGGDPEPEREDFSRSVKEESEGDDDQRRRGMT